MEWSGRAPTPPAIEAGKGAPTTRSTPCLRISVVQSRQWASISARTSAAYVEIIKYALGDQVGALATLRGLLYTTEEAGKLGFFHEVVEPTKLLATAIQWAKCITPKCNTAYAMSK
jgi:hypothetical protein